MEKVRGFELVSYAPYRIQLPLQATKNSAGCDFVLPEDVIILPGEAKEIKTYVKAYMPENESLELYIRSSYGNKKHLMLCNQVGLVDSDYYDCANNEGNISATLYNYGKEIQVLKKGDRFMQGVFREFKRPDGPIVTTVRAGGTGSTGK